MKKTMILAMTAMAMALAQGPPQGGPMGPGGPPPQGGPGAAQAPQFGEVKAYLGLSDAQISSMQGAQKSAMDGLKPLIDQLQTKSQALRDTLEKGTTDAAAVGKAVLEIDALRKQVAASMKATQLQLVNILTADQKTKLAKLEDAAKLQPVIGQAGALGLLAPPESPARP